jgi:16S rRNA (guanine527-N7)-methyltransferase
MTAFDQYRDLLLRWNQRVNLTAASSPAEVDEHIADCLHLVEHVPEAGTLLDVGSGGGLPAIVIAVARPGVSVTALEPTHKKHAFLRTAARELGLRNFEARAERWEDHPGRGYDVATSRATLDLVTWLGIGARFVRPGGRVLGMEGRDQIALGPGMTRHPYEIGGKTRAIVIKIV